MTWQTFASVIKRAKELGGPELSITGMGEALMHPEFCAMIRHARKELPGVYILLSTNGLPIAKGDPSEIVRTLRECNVHVYISAHRPEIAGKALAILGKAGVSVGVNSSFITSGFDWAGQVEWHGANAPRSECQYLAQQWGCVLEDGRIINCCFDAHALYPAGHIDDDVLPTLRPIPLCDKCHLTPP
jgi:hypothetical protein